MWKQPERFPRSSDGKDPGEKLPRRQLVLLRAFAVHFRGSGKRHSGSSHISWHWCDNATHTLRKIIRQDLERFLLAQLVLLRKFSLLLSQVPAGVSVARSLPSVSCKPASIVAVKVSHSCQREGEPQQVLNIHFHFCRLPQAARRPPPLSLWKQSCSPACALAVSQQAPPQMRESKTEEEA